MNTLDSMVKALKSLICSPSLPEDSPLLAQTSTIFGRLNENGLVDFTSFLISHIVFNPQSTNMEADVRVRLLSSIIKVIHQRSMYPRVFVLALTQLKPEYFKRYDPQVSFLYCLFFVLKLSTHTQIIVPLMILKSQNDYLRRDAERFLLENLVNLIPNVPLSGKDILETIRQEFMTNPRLNKHSNTPAILNAIRQYFESNISPDILNEFNERYKMEKKYEPDPNSVASIFLQYGPVCTSSVEVIKAIFTIQLLDLTTFTPFMLMELIYIMAEHQKPSETDKSKLEDYLKQHKVTLSIPEDTKTWSESNIHQFLRTTYPAFNWSEVMRSMDTPNMVITSVESFRFILNFYMNGSCSHDFPFDIFRTPWTNSFPLISFLVFSLHVFVDDVFFWNHSPNQAVYNETPALKYRIWLSIDLVDILISLFDREQELRILKCILNEPITTPCNVLLCTNLLETQQPWSEARINIIQRLVTVFMSNRMNDSYYPIQLLYEKNYDLFVNFIQDIYHKNKHSINELLYITKDIDGLVNQLLTLKDNEFTLTLYLHALYVNQIHCPLQKFLEDQVEQQHEPYLDFLMSFVDHCITEKYNGDNVLLEYMYILMIFLKDKMLRMNVFNDYESKFKALQDRLNEEPYYKEVEYKQIDSEISNLIGRYSQGEFSLDMTLEKIKVYHSSPHSYYQKLYSRLLAFLYENSPIGCPQITSRHWVMIAQLVGQMINQDLVPQEQMNTIINRLFEMIGSENDDIIFFAVTCISEFQSKICYWKYCYDLIINNMYLKSVYPDFVDGIITYVKNMDNVSRHSHCFNDTILLDDVQSPSDASNNANVCLDMDRIHKYVYTPIYTFTPCEMEPEPDHISEKTRDDLVFLLNMLSNDSIEEHAKKLSGWMTDPSVMEWLAWYMTNKRVPSQLVYHTTYLSLIHSIHNKTFDELIYQKSLVMCRALISSSTLNSSTSQNERTNLKNLGSWMGLLTYGQNKPLPINDLDLKSILLYAYQSGKLLGVLPFISEILKYFKKQSSLAMVFNPLKQPYLLTLLSIIKQICTISNLKTSVVCNLDIICHNFEIQPDDIPVFYCNINLFAPTMKSNPDFKEGEKSNVPEDNVSENSNSSHPLNSPVSDSMKELANAPEFRPQSTTLHPQVPPASGVPTFFQLSNSVPPSSINPAYNTVRPYNGMNRLTSSLPNGSSMLFSHLQLNDSEFTNERFNDLIRGIINEGINNYVTMMSRYIIQTSLDITSNMIYKDFATESDHNLLKEAAVSLLNSIYTNLFYTISYEDIYSTLNRYIMDIMNSKKLPLTKEKTKEIVDSGTEKSISVALNLLKNRVTNNIYAALSKRLEPDIQKRQESIIRTHLGYKDTGRMKMNPLFSPAYSNGINYTLRPDGQLTPQQFAVYKNLPKADLEKWVPKSKVKSMPKDILNANTAMTRCLPLLQTIHTESTSHAFKGVAYSVLPISSPLRNAMTQLMAYMEKLTDTTIKNDFCKSFLTEMTKYIPNGAFSDMNSLQIHIYITIFLNFVKNNYTNVRSTITTLFMNSDSMYTKDMSFFKLLLENDLVDQEALDLILLQKLKTCKDNRMFDILLRIYDQCVLNRSISLELPHTLEQLEDYCSNHYSLAQEHQNQKLHTLLENIKNKRKMTETNTFIRNNIQSIYQYVVKNMDQFILHPEELIQFLEYYHISVSAKKDDTEGSILYFICYLLDYAYILDKSPSNNNANAFANMDKAADMIILLFKSLPSKDQFYFFKSVLDGCVCYVLTAHDHIHTNPDSSFLFHFLQAINTEITEYTLSNNMGYQYVLQFHKFLERIQPKRAPGFVFCWFHFLSSAVLIKPLEENNPEYNNSYKNLLVNYLKFLVPYLKSDELMPNITSLYHGLYRLFVELMFDCPSFLMDYYLELLVEIPYSVPKLHNIILSSDMYGANASQISVSELNIKKIDPKQLYPTIKIDYISLLNSMNGNVINLLSNYLKSHELKWLKQFVNLIYAGQNYNIPLIHYSVFYVLEEGYKAMMKNSEVAFPVDFYMQLLCLLNAEGRYYVLNAIFDNIRYNNIHTIYCVSLILYLFSTLKEECIKEQIISILFERYVGHKPYPWGFLVLLNELVHNPTYNFWNHDFIRNDPETESYLRYILNRT